jgi:3-deoxy-D-manno-octulosonic-acid transferase
MNPIVRIPYSGVGALVTLASALAPAGSGKTLKSLRSRRFVGRRFATWSELLRDSDRPVIWLHAASVGEGLQALPLIGLLRNRRSDVQIIYTHYSPSAESFAARVGADYSDYLPFDTRSEMDAALDAIGPAVIAFSKADVWPILAERAASRGVKLALLSATMPESSRRRSMFARLALSDAYGLMDAVGAVDEADADRLVEAGAHPNRVTVTGDTRYDQVWTRSRSAPGEIVTRLSSASPRVPTLVAGSTWPSDEEHLLPAWSAVVAQRPGARLIIAPHELKPDHLEAIETWARAIGLTLARISDAAAAESSVILVDQYGLLGDLYALGDFAYVGGGFQSAGLHSLLEPAAFGVPVIIGPKHTDNRDARALEHARAAFRRSNSREISAWLIEMIDSPETRKQAGNAAREVVRSGLGAAERSYSIIESLLEDVTAKTPQSRTRE